MRFSRRFRVSRRLPAFQPAMMPRSRLQNPRITRNAGGRWNRFHAWAELWRLEPPRLSTGWVNLPAVFAQLAAEDGMIERPVFEPPAADEDALRLERLIGLPLPEGLRELHAVHDGSYAPLLPY